MSTKTTINVNIYPTVRGDKLGIDRKILSYIKEKDIPFTVNTNWKALAEVGRDNAEQWEVTSMSAFGNFRNSHLLEGVNIDFEKINEIEKFFKNAVIVVTTISESDGYCVNTHYHFYKDGKEVFTSSSYEEQIYSEKDYEPTQKSEEDKTPRKLPF